MFFKVLKWSLLEYSNRIHGDYPGDKRKQTKSIGHIIRGNIHPKSWPSLGVLTSFINMTTPGGEIE